MDKPLPKNANLIPSHAKRVFKGQIFNVYHWPQKMFDGSSATFEMVRRADTVQAICEIDGKVVLLKEQQPGSPVGFGFPGGRVDAGENIYDCIRREVKEETGLEFKNWKLVHVVQMAHKVEGFIYTFIASDKAGESSQNLDGGEKITITQTDFSDILELVKSGELENNYLLTKLAKGKAKLADVLNDEEIG